MDIHNQPPELNPYFRYNSIYTIVSRLKRYMARYEWIFLKLVGPRWRSRVFEMFAIRRKNQLLVFGYKFHLRVLQVVMVFGDEFRLECAYRTHESNDV